MVDSQESVVLFWTSSTNSGFGAQEDDSFVIGHRLIHVDNAPPRLSILLSTENLLLNAWYESLHASLIAWIVPGAWCWLSCGVWALTCPPLVRRQQCSEVPGLVCVDHSHRYTIDGPDPCTPISIVQIVVGGQTVT